MYIPIEMTTQSALSQPDEPQDKNNKTFSLESQTDWLRVEAMSDDEIDLSEIPPLSRAQIRQMKPLSQVLAKRGIDAPQTAVSTVSVYHDDGHVTTHQLAPTGNVVILEPDVLRYFPNSAAVNRALRALIDLIPQPQ